MAANLKLSGILPFVSGLLNAYFESSLFRNKRIFLSTRLWTCVALNNVAKICVYKAERVAKAFLLYGRRVH
jgi:hypothetical protein